MGYTRYSDLSEEQKAQRRAASARYNQLHREKCCLNDKRYREKHPEQMKKRKTMSKFYAEARRFRLLGDAFA